MKKILTIILAVAIAFLIFKMLGILFVGMLYLLKWIIFGVVAILVYIFLKNKL